MNFEKIVGEHNIIFLTKFGSHLYGTDTPESDTDYKGVYLPTIEQVILGKYPKLLKFDSNRSNEKNTKEDIDCEIYSLHYFLELASKGETVALDMLHSRANNIIFNSSIWTELYINRSKFYTKNMKAFLGYCLQQAAKYGLKGSRIASAKVLVKFLNNFDPDSKLKDVWDEMPTDNNMLYMLTEPGEIRTFNFCGKQIQETVKVSYALDIVNRFINQYGERAKQAERDEGVDWKAMSHAIRAAFQLQEIYITGDLFFPLLDKEFLKKVKAGDLKFKEVQETLELAIKSVKKLADESSYPETVDREWVDNFIINTYKIK